MEQYTMEIEMRGAENIILDGPSSIGAMQIFFDSVVRNNPTLSKSNEDALFNGMAITRYLIYRDCINQYGYHMDFAERYLSVYTDAGSYLKVGEPWDLTTRMLLLKIPHALFALATTNIGNDNAVIEDIFPDEWDLINPSNIIGRFMENILGWCNVFQIPRHILVNSFKLKTQVWEFLDVNPKTFESYLKQSKTEEFDKYIQENMNIIKQM